LVGEAKKLLATEDFHNRKYRQIAEALFKLESAGKSTQAGEVISYLQDEELGAAIARLAIEKNPYSSGAQALTEEKKGNLKEFEEKIREAQVRGEEKSIRDLQLRYQALLTEYRKQKTEDRAWRKAAI